MQCAMKHHRNREVFERGTWDGWPSSQQAKNAHLNGTMGKKAAQEPLVSDGNNRSESSGAKVATNGKVTSNTCKTVK